MVKDDKGVYYYPFPQNKQVRMYVREDRGAVWFRLWNETDAALWDDHGWIPWEAVQQAMALKKPSSFNPEAAYDLDVARAVLSEAGGGTDSKGP
jgi:hypothetical protein